MHRLITYRLQSLQDLAAMEFPEREWLVAGLLPRGSLTLFAGREKSGKSLFVADLAACIASAEPFLDREVVPGPVILVPAEENLRDIQLRLATRLAGTTDAPLFVLPVNSSDDNLLDLAILECITALREVIVETEPAALILDPFRELHRLAENDADAMGPLLRPLRQLAHETDTAIVLTHHMGKSGNFRGSTAIRAAVDQEWAFTRPHDPESTATDLAGTLAVEGRFGPRQQLGIRLGMGCAGTCLPRRRRAPQGRDRRSSRPWQR